MRKSEPLPIVAGDKIPFPAVRIPLLLLALFSLALPVRAQVPEPGAMTQNPGAAQDEEAAREKLLKAADQLDLIQSGAESTKVEVDGMKTEFAQMQSSITQLQGANAALKEQISSLQDALDKAEAERARERQVLLDEVAKLVASKSGGTPKPSVKKHEIAETPPADEASAPPPPAPHHSTEVHAPDVESAAGSGANPAPVNISGTDDRAPVIADDSGPAKPDPAPDADPAPSKPQEGYYHVVESGETLTMICAAYRQQGVKVSVAQVRKANGLTEKSALKVGQKLFIPKPGA